MLLNPSIKKQPEFVTFDNIVPQIKYQLIDHQQQRLNNNFTKKYQPTENELCQAVVLIKKLMPNRSLQRAIILMHEILNKNVQTQINIHNNSQGNISLTSLINQPRVTTEVIKNYFKDDLLKTSFSNTQQQMKYKQKRLIAKSFVARGYGYQFALQQFKKAKLYSNLQKEPYKRLVGSVVSQAFRKLQTFLIQDCAKKIVPLSKQQLSKIMTHLLSSTYYGDRVLVLKKFLRFLFGLSNVTLCEVQTFTFYKTILLQVRPTQQVQDFRVSLSLGSKTNQANLVIQNRPVNIQINTHQSALWNSQQDMILVKTFLMQKSTIKTFQILCKDDPTLFTLDRIRNRLSQLYFKALQNLKMTHFEEFQQCTISQSHIKFLSKSKAAFQIRIHLLKYLYFADSTSPSSYQLLKSVLSMFSDQQDLITTQQYIDQTNFNKQPSQAYELHNFQVYSEQQKRQKM